MLEGRGQRGEAWPHTLPSDTAPNPSRLPFSCQLSLWFVPLETRGFARGWFEFAMPA